MNGGDDGEYKIVGFGRYLEGGVREAFLIASLYVNFDFSLGYNSSINNLGIHIVFDVPFLCGSL